MAVGTPHDGEYIEGTCVDSLKGAVFIYDFSISTRRWLQRGEKITSDKDGDRLGAGVSLSSDGNSIAIGSTGADDKGDNSGSVRVLRWSDQEQVWVTLAGGSIPGPISLGETGDKVSLSSDGSRVCIGTTPEVTENRQGFVQVFETGILVSFLIVGLSNDLMLGRRSEST